MLSICRVGDPLSLKRTIKGIADNVRLVNREVAQLVAHLVWDQRAAGSSPVFPTIFIMGFSYEEIYNHILS